MRSSIAALDHLVLATPDLVTTAAWVAERTGIRPSTGGQHVGRGTRNMLCSLSSTSYLEIVGPDPDQPDHAGPRPFGVDDLSDAAMVAWAVAVPNMDAALHAARNAGYDPGEAAPMQRQRPDGVLLRWTLTLAPSTAVPFLIDWDDSPHPAATAAPGLEIADLQARHPRPDHLADTLRALGVTMGILPGAEALVVELHGPLGSISFG
jgi:hypothetical protein